MKKATLYTALFCFIIAAHLSAMNNNAFLVAMVEDNNTALQKLIKNNANLQATSSLGWTPLMYAAWNGSTQCLATIIQKTTNLDLIINKKNTSQKTALMLAAYQGEVDCIKLLMDAGADIKIKDAGNWSALWWAVYKNRYKTTKILLELAYKQGIHSDLITEYDTTKRSIFDIIEPSQPHKRSNGARLGILRLLNTYKHKK